VGEKRRRQTLLVAYRLFQSSPGTEGLEQAKNIVTVSNKVEKLYYPSTVEKKERMFMWLRALVH